MKLSKLVVAMAAATAFSTVSPMLVAQDEGLEEVMVTGIRGSLQNSAAIKRNAGEVVESITAEDVGKLPDPNVAETLTRIPGVQGYRYGGEGASPVGEGSGLTIRGLSGQTASRLNGRTYFTAGGREFNIESAIPGMIAGIDVFKNPSAKHIEGGIGGLIDIKTRRPLDMDERVISGAVTARYNDFVGDIDPEIFGLYSETWNLESGGELGFLFAATQQKSHNRSDSTPSNTGANLRRAVRADSAEYATLAAANQSYVGRSDVWHLVDATASDDPSNLIATTSQNAHVFQEDIIRDRKGVNTAIQWAPNDDFELYAEGNYNYYKYEQDYRFMIMSDSRTVQGLETEAFDTTEAWVNRNANGGENAVLATQALASGTFLNSTFNSLGGKENRPYETWLVATGFDWNITDRLNMTTDVSYVKADQTQDNRSVTLRPKVGNTWDITRDLKTSPHNISISGPDLADPNNFVFVDYGNGTHQVFDDSGYAVQTDFKYEVDGFFNAVLFGGRFASQESNYNNYSFGGKALTTNGSGLLADQSNAISVADFAELTETAPKDWVKNKTDFAGGYLVFSPSLLNSDALRTNFPQANIPADGSIPENLGGRRYAKEDTLAAYVMGEFATAGERIRGNLGVRVIQADVDARAMVWDTTGTTAQFVPFAASSSYTDVLPSFNITGELQDDLLLRFGYSKGITRPTLGSLNPTISVDQTTGRGSAGNPDLKPLEADSYDLSLEHYFGPANYASIAVFNKEIDGFINTAESCETVSVAPAYTGAVDNLCSNGQYFITRQVNAEAGSARGVEVAVQTFFDMLPGAWSNFGVSASYTHVKTENPIVRDGKVVNVPQAFQSDDSYSIAGMYENEGLSARLVYTYRSDFILFGVAANPAVGRYVKGYGVLDGSINYNISDTYSVTFTASNLTDSAPVRYVGEPGSVTTGFQNQYYINGRNFAVGLRATF
ncbi:TonB-dependent receptor [Cellvibrio mixtus]|uniref:TonB-dependent receptor n=1 Tax=Cellvibrio mixtus TaxID=39650 RepID=A0A266Q2V4_9GAMM|nr:TonB-dependent receptor [Cellvibrio mixtus]OZY84198.1 TonB-dependent receptor [Cellvibrio mixtus]